MWYVLITLIGLALAEPATAVPSTGTLAESDPRAPAAYVFVPGDVVDITVSSHTGYDRTITISPDGRIQIPGVGEIVAAGLTSAQLAARIQEGLNAELVDPQVTVSLKELNKQAERRVSVLGAVKTPGVYELKEHATLAELLAAAGGPAPVADLSRVTITRAGGKKAVADLSGATRTGDAGSEAALEPGDLILVPEGVPPTVLVLGEVARPGSYALEGETRLLNALSLAGGPTSKADLRRLTLTRAGQSGKEIIDLQELLTKGQQSNMAANVVLRPGDTLVLPESARKYYVLGEVNRAEAYPLKPNDRLLDAITTAGGSTHEADLKNVMLIRKDEKGQAVGRRVDLKQMMKQGNMAHNEPLREDDVIFVPDRKQARPITDYLAYINPFTTLLYLFH